MSLDEIINHARHRNYLDEIAREKLRVKSTGEVFTPLEVITKKCDLKILILGRVIIINGIYMCSFILLYINNEIYV